MLKEELLADRRVGVKTTITTIISVGFLITLIFFLSGSLILLTGTALLIISGLGIYLLKKRGKPKQKGCLLD